MLKTGKNERAELYKERNTQVLISKFLSGDISELKPTFDPKLGYRYPAVEAVIGEASKGEDFLNRLYEARILERKLYDRIIYCPSCGSKSISIHYCCPYCKSFNIQKGSLIEHVKCGHMDVEENFRKGNKLVCPKCHEELKKPDMDYRKAGIWCTCEDCGKSFDIPVPRHFCRDCQANFTFEEIEVKDVYSYSLNEKVRGKFPLDGFLLLPLESFSLKTVLKLKPPPF